jgi:hypothetical protein
MGPGTHIIDRINHRILPTTKTDFVAMLHDIDYLMGSGSDKWTKFADDRAIQHAPNTFTGLLMKAGLSVRKILNLPFNKTTKNAAVASDLMKIAKSDPIYAKLFDKYQIDPLEYPDFYFE